MTNIDTSTEAVERLLDGVTPGPWQVDGPSWNQIIWSSNGNRVCFMAHSNGLHVVVDLAAASFIAAARDLVPALLKERDEARAKLAVAVEALGEIAATEVFSMGIGIDPRPTNEAKIARATLTKIKRADHE